MDTQISQPKEKVFNKNFILLWQGQFVSSLGDVVYELALGFWILAITGSTALMGTLAASAMLPRIIVSPLAGTVIDRVNRKKLMISMDMIRGIVITTIGIIAISGYLQIWMVFAAGVTLGLCGAFYTPSVVSVIPDIVPTSTVMSANSLLGMIPTGANVLGSSLGGILYSTIGAPLLFLFNGISYLVSGSLQLPMNVPKVFKKEEKHFFAEMKDGYKYIWAYVGLRNLLISASIYNLICSIAVILFLPFFEKNPHLGAGKYGFTMAVMTMGMFIGMLITSICKIPANRRFVIFMIGTFISGVCFAFCVKVSNYYLMLSLVLIAGVFMAMTNVFIHTIIQITIPGEMRGKVFSFVEMSSQAFMPIGMLIGGVLGEFIPISTIIFSCFMLVALFVIPFMFSKSLREFMNYDAK
jgi:MFS family permease